MPESRSVTVQLEQPVLEQLDALSRSTNRSQSVLAAEAITAYVELHDWQRAEIEAGLAELDAGQTVGEEEARKVFDRLIGR